jgi:MerR family transcriptional regulator, thiopeptide resistance regulator
MKDNSAAIATQFGTSLKALRLYERLGMLVPPRTKAGWRVYGPAEIERLHAILSLKQLGLKLARIAEMLRAGTTDLDTLLSVQEEMLLRARMETDHALTLIRIAKARLRAEDKLSADDFAAMVRRISATVLRWTPELDDLARRFYTPEQMENIRRRERDPAEAARLSAAWEEIMSEIDGLREPSCEDALALGRRMVALFRQSAEGDRDFWNNSARFWQEAVSDPALAGQLRMDPARYEFVGRILGELKNRGELNF